MSLDPRASEAVDEAIYVLRLSQTTDNPELFIDGLEVALRYCREALEAQQETST